MYSKDILYDLLPVGLSGGRIPLTQTVAGFFTEKLGDLGTSFLGRDLFFWENGANGRFHF